MQSLKTEKQKELLHELSITPLKKSVTVAMYMRSLRNGLLDFQEEIEYNISISVSAKEIFDYLSKVKILFIDSLMFFEGSFSLLLFPEEIGENYDKKEKAYSFKKANLLIFKMAIDFINRVIKHIKYTFENNILFENFKILSKFVIVGKSCKAIDIVELGYALYYTGFFINRNGEVLLLYDFIENLGHYFGLEIVNMRQRIIELQRRIKNPFVFLQKLINSLINNLKRQK